MTTIGQGCQNNGSDGPQGGCPRCFAMQPPTMGQADTETTQATTTGVNFDQLINNVLVEDGVFTAVMIPFGIAQCRLESDNYTSNVFKTCNNLNGYKVPPGGLSAWQDAQCIISPEQDYYGHYASVENSVHELSYWWQRRAQAGVDLSTITSLSSYVNVLQANNWFTSNALAYQARMTAVSGLISFQNATGINTQGTDTTTIAIVGGLAVLVLIGVIR